ncbi:hypothetical protein PLICRDRAFT_223275 [Plicaturopsis crispa FD-325 SS-3]|nr:hypothetical protein PLICRDRAFT_223275 [Plicaturopsis crispa FD-325 SS-3]
MTFVIKNTASQHCPIQRTHQMNNDHPACVGKLPLSLSSARRLGAEEALIPITAAVQFYQCGVFLYHWALILGHFFPTGYCVQAPHFCGDGI